MSGTHLKIPRSKVIESDKHTLDSTCSMRSSRHMGQAATRTDRQTDKLSIWTGCTRINGTHGIHRHIKANKMVQNMRADKADVQRNWMRRALEIEEACKERMSRASKYERHGITLSARKCMRRVRKRTRNRTLDFRESRDACRNADRPAAKKQDNARATRDWPYM